MKSLNRGWVCMWWLLDALVYGGIGFAGGYLWCLLDLTEELSALGCFF